MRRYFPLYLILPLLLTSMTQCDDDGCLGPRNRSIDVELANNQVEYAVGDTLWLSSSFPEIAENFAEPDALGGLLSLVPVSVVGDSSYRAATKTELEPVQSDGLMVSDTSGIAAQTWQFLCREGQCGFRVGYRILTAGTYLLSIPPLTVEEPVPTLSSCGGAVFLIREIENVPTQVPDNLPETVPVNGVDYRLRYDSFFQPNVLFLFGAE